DRMRPRESNAASGIRPIATKTIEKRKLKGEQLKAAREKYSNFSRAALPPPTITVPLPRPSRIPPPSASALSRPTPVFRPDPAAAAAIRRGPQPAAITTGRPSTVPRASLVPRASFMERPTVRASAPRPSMIPHDPDAPLLGLPFGSNSNLLSSSSSATARGGTVAFEPMVESLGRILRNEPLPMAPGARASSIARRHMPRPSMAPGGINIFTATGMERLEAERLLAATPGIRRAVNRLDESGGAHRSRVRFEVVESIQEQRESVGDEVDEEPSSSTSSSILQPTLTLNQPSMIRREPSSLSSLYLQSTTRRNDWCDPPRSILKQKRRSSRGAAPSSSSSSTLVSSSSTSIVVNSTVETAAIPDENQPARDTPSRNRPSPMRNGSSKKKKRKNPMMEVFAALDGMNEEEKRETPIGMMEACMDKLKKMIIEKKKEKEEEE
ncbi:hypothetical protein PENTCL1PPCAC_2051, partial [Pristionchus entomophagus]